jgi:hypothetical protein
MHSVEKKIELGMNVAVRRGVHEYIGVVIRVEDAGRAKAKTPARPR